MTSFTRLNTEGYTDAGLRNLNRAFEIIVTEHGYDAPGLPDAVRAEVEARIRAGLTNTHRKNLPVRALLALWAD